jgi:sugar lactone lactonase YvrE
MRISDMKLRTLILAALIAATGSVLAQDMPLSQILIEGERWQPVLEGLGSSDAPCADAKGNFYFTDPRNGTNIFTVGADGAVKTFLPNAPRVSGMKFGPDGRLYACQSGLKRVVSYEIPGGKSTVLAEDVQPNDLVVTHKGYLYFTETGKKQVSFINTKTGEKRAADTGITAPNGITLSPDQGTLAVSDYRGLYVWVFRIEPDGSLTHKEPYMTMRTEVDVNARSEDGRSPVYKTASGGDGMTVDTLGRYYVATAIGIQVFDPTGRLCGVIHKPENKGISSVGLAGPNLEYLYVTCTDKIFRRKLNTRGVLFFQPPLTGAPTR